MVYSGRTYLKKGHIFIASRIKALDELIIPSGTTLPTDVLFGATYSNFSNFGEMCTYLDESSSITTENEVRNWALGIPSNVHNTCIYQLCSGNFLEIKRSTGTVFTTWYEYETDPTSSSEPSTFLSERYCKSDTGRGIAYHLERKNDNVDVFGGYTCIKTNETTPRIRESYSVGGALSDGLSCFSENPSGTTRVIAPHIYFEGCPPTDMVENHGYHFSNAVVHKGNFICGFGSGCAILTDGVDTYPYPCYYNHTSTLSEHMGLLWFKDGHVLLSSANSLTRTDESERWDADLDDGNMEVRGELACTGTFTLHDTGVQSQIVWENPESIADSSNDPVRWDPATQHLYVDTTTTCSERYKKVLRVLDNGEWSTKQKLEALQLKEFQRVDKRTGEEVGTPEIGITADMAYSVDEKMAHISKEGTPEKINVEYMIGFLVNEVKRLSAQVDYLVGNKPRRQKKV